MVGDKIRNQEIILGGEQVYLPLTEGSGSAAMDRSGNLRNATVVSPGTWATPGPLSGYCFDTGTAGTGRLTIPVTGLDLGEEMSVSFWVKVGNSTDTGIFLFADTGVGGESIRISQANTPPTIYVTLDSDIESDPLVAGRWYHIAVTIKISAPILSKLYVNGVLTDSRSYSSPGITPTRVWVGDDGAGSGQVQEYIQDFSMYSRILSADEIRFTYERASVLTTYILWLMEAYWALQTTPRFTTGWVDTTTELDKYDVISIMPMPGAATGINIEGNLRRHDPKVQVDVWTNKGRARLDLLMREVDRILCTYRRTLHHSQIGHILWSEPIDMGSEKQGFQRYSFDVTGLRWSTQ